jgi:proton-coupled amino acid transporter
MYTRQGEAESKRLEDTRLTALLITVLFQDYESYTPHNDMIHKVKWDGLWYVMAVTIYSMEGVGLILSLKTSGTNQAQFPALFTGTITIISVFMAVFGVAGYIAFGDGTEAPITLNMTSNWAAIFVKLALCLGLYLTFPIMMFPSKQQL